MEWYHLIFALIVITAYVIKHIVSAQQDAAAEREHGSRRTGQTSAVVPNSDAEAALERTALDKRIQEATQRRREREETGDEEKPMRVVSRQIPMPAPAGPPSVPRYKPLPRPGHADMPEVRRVPRSERPRPVKLMPPEPVQPTPMPPAALAPSSVAFQPSAIPVVMSVSTPLPAGATGETVTPVAATVAPIRLASPAVRQALDLLKNHQMLASAFVLREILDKPVALQRGRHVR